MTEQTERAEPLGEFPLKKYSLGKAFVEAIEVTPALVFSRPTAGDAIQRFGEQIEIMHPGPAHKKSYAQVGDFIVRVKDRTGKDDYTIVSASSFNVIFKEYTKKEATAYDVPVDLLMKDGTTGEKPDGWVDDGTLFKLADGKLAEEPKVEVQTDIRDEVPVVEVKAPETPESVVPATEAGAESAPATEEPKLTAAEKKELAKQKRLQELGDIGSLEAPLGGEAEKL